jgi:recombination protein RecA
MAPQPALATPAAKTEALKSAVKQIEAQHGRGSIMRLGESGASLEVETVSTGSLSVDVALGGRGLPRGRVVEVFGPEGSGKSTFCQTVVASVQRQGGVAAYIDAEHAVDPSFARRLGVNVEALLLSQPDSGEQALDIAEILARSNAVDVIVVDSVAALVPKAELEGEMGETHVGLQARLMSHALRKLCAAISRSRAVVIFINQLREKIGVMFGSPETTPGGRALKFYSSVRIDIRRIGALKEGDVTIGNRVRAKIVKNKIAPPFQQAEFDLLFASGISREGEILDLGELKGVLDKSGSSYGFGSERLGLGRDKARQFLAANPKVAAAVEKEIRAKVASNGAPTAANGKPKEAAARSKK